jgi:glucose/arabinose dehydrogenase
MIRILAIIVALTQIALYTVSAQAPFSFRVVASGLSMPWEVVWGPDDQLWVTERTGRRVVRVNPQTGAVTRLLSVDESYDPGESWHEGVLGLALDPDLLKNVGRDYVYLAYTYDVDPGAGLSRRLKVRRYTYDAAKSALIAPVDVITNLPAHDDHGGGRLVFGPDQKLYLTRGDNGANWLANYCMPNRAQAVPTAAQVAAGDFSTYIGKILRMNLDGSIPADNPVIDGVRSHIYTYGHRNPQGLKFGPTGLLYASEHGPNSDDELNLIVAGNNYGWPHIAGYRDDRGYVYANESEWKGTFTPPLRTFFTVPEGYDFQKSGGATIAAGGLDIYTAADGIPDWAVSVLQPGMTMGRVYRVKLSADGRSAVGANEELFRTANRYRDMAIGRDQRTFYFVTDNNGLGRTTDPSGARVTTFANPGSVLEFKYQ